MRKRHRSSIDRLLPLTPTMTCILVALLSGEKHGYAILKESLAQIGCARVSVGRLYPVLRRALAEGLIVESDRRTLLDVRDKRRRYYRITPLGRHVAAAEIDRLRSIVRLARHNVDF